MASITHVKKSRKAYRCSKCGKEIPRGSPYVRGDLNFSPSIIRCEACGLESWEVTTSDYQLRVGEVVYRWQSNNSTETGDLEDTLDNIKSELDDIKCELEDRLDNMPEGLKDSDTGSILQERIDGLDSAISDLENIDCDIDEEDDEQEKAEEIVGLIEEALSNIVL